MVVWHVAFNIAYKNDTKKSVEVVKDAGGVRLIQGSFLDFAEAKILPKFVEFSTLLGLTDTPVLPENVASYTFRFSSTTTNGSVNVLGSTDALGNQVVTNDLAAVSADLNADQDFINYFVGAPNVSLLFINTDYVDYSENNSSSEAWNLLKGLQSFGASYLTFTDISAAGLSDLLLQGNKLIIPENEESSLVLSPESRALIAGYVANGNNLLVFYLTRWIQEFNNIFGFNLETAEGSGPYDKRPAAAGTIFSGGAASIPSLSATEPLAVSTLPEGSINVYGDDSSSALCIIPYGNGNIYCFGWDWYDAQPFGAEGGEWLALFEMSVLS